MTDNAGTDNTGSGSTETGDTGTGDTGTGDTGTGRPEMDTVEAETADTELAGTDPADADIADSDAADSDAGGDVITDPSATDPTATDPTRPRVGLIMGSDSDWPTMEAAAEALAEFGVPFEVGVVSAHRTPQRMLDYAAGAAARGISVIIAGAGGAAHLPGMVASATPLPVIGVPVQLRTLDGLDSLLSIVQMPAGVPVATVSIGGARNAGLLAIRILGSADAGLRSRMEDFQKGLETMVLEKDQALRDKLLGEG